MANETSCAGGRPKVCAGDGARTDDLTRLVDVVGIYGRTKVDETSMLGSVHALMRAPVELLVLAENRGVERRTRAHKTDEEGRINMPGCAHSAPSLDLRIDLGSSETPHRHR